MKTAQNKSARLHRLALLLLPLSLTAGCQSLTHSERGALGGGVVGGTAGALIGKAAGNTGAGAVIGTAIGAIAGSAHGRSIDRLEAKTDQVIAAQATEPIRGHQGPLSIQEVVEMTQAGVTDSTIINQIRTSGSRYHLTSRDIVYLTQSGVPQRVIQEMQQTASRRVQRVAVPPRVVYEPVPVYAPRPRIGIGYHYHRRCR